MSTSAASSSQLHWAPLTVARYFAIVIATIVITGAVANYALHNLAPHPQHPVADVLKRFDLGHEPSIPAFYSSVAMLACAFGLLVLGLHDPQGGHTRRRYWLALAALFACLAIDENVMFHEMGTAMMERLNWSGPFYFSWVIPGAIFSILVALAFTPFLIDLPRRTGGLILLSGAVFVSGAIGMELVAGVIFQNASTEQEAMRSIAHVISQAIEEGLEMVGVAIFFCALIDYAKQSRLQILMCPPNGALSTEEIP